MGTEGSKGVSDRSGRAVSHHCSSPLTARRKLRCDMKTMIAKTLLALVLAMPTTMPAWDRGKVERCATLPAGEAHPEGICLDREGNVYVVTVAWNRSDSSGGTLIVFDRNGKHLRTVTIPRATPWLLDLRFHPHTGQLLVIDYKGGKVLSVDPVTGASAVFMTVTGEDPRLGGVP